LLHLSVHTSAAGDGEITVATAPGAELAEQIADAWFDKLRSPGLCVLRNREAANTPLVEALAKNHPASRYAPIRLVVSQTFFLEGRPWRWEQIKKRLIDSLVATMARDALSAPADPWIAPD
jgi:hypothetical protein